MTRDEAERLVQQHRKIHTMFETPAPAVTSPTIITTYRTQAAVGDPPNFGSKTTLDHYDRCSSVWRTLYDGDDRETAHRIMLNKRDEVGYPVVRVLLVEREEGTNVFVRRMTETIQQRLAAPGNKRRKTSRG